MQFGRSWAKFRPSIAKSAPTSGRRRSTLVRICPVWPTSGQLRQGSPQCGGLANLGPHSGEGRVPYTLGSDMLRLRCLPNAHRRQACRHPHVPGHFSADLSVRRPVCRGGVLPRTRCHYWCAPCLPLAYVMRLALIFRHVRSGRGSSSFVPMAGTQLACCLSSLAAFVRRAHPLRSDWRGILSSGSGVCFYRFSLQKETHIGVRHGGALGTGPQRFTQTPGRHYLRHEAFGMKPAQIRGIQVDWAHFCRTRPTLLKSASILPDFGSEPVECRPSVGLVWGHAWPDFDQVEIGAGLDDTWAKCGRIEAEISQIRSELGQGQTKFARKRRRVQSTLGQIRPTWARTLLSLCRIRPGSDNIDQIWPEHWERGGARITPRNDDRAMSRRCATPTLTPGVGPKSGAMVVRNFVSGKWHSLPGVGRILVPRAPDIARRPMSSPVPPTDSGSRRDPQSRTALRLRQRT